MVVASQCFVARAVALRLGSLHLLISVMCTAFGALREK